MKYTVTKHYRGEGYDGQLRVYERGEVVTLDNADYVEWLSRDAPGLLEPFEEPKARAPDKPAKTRQIVKAPAKRKVADAKD